MGLEVWPEQRVQVSPDRFRIPDVCVTAAEPDEQFFTSPPLVCIEIFSKNVRMSEIQERIDDYLAFGVPYVWIMNPHTRKAWRCTPGAMREVCDLRVEQPLFVAPLNELFK